MVVLSFCALRYTRMHALASLARVECSCMCAKSASHAAGEAWSALMPCTRTARSLWGGGWGGKVGWLVGCGERGEEESEKVL